VRTAELVWLAEHESLIGEAAIEATVVARTGRPRHLVKAVTYQGLSSEPLSVDELGRAQDGLG
jgi:hypothetical protein